MYNIKIGGSIQTSAGSWQGSTHHCTLHPFPCLGPAWGRGKEAGL